MLILHVDDLMVTSDGSPEMQKLTEEIHGQYPFGEWVNVDDQGCVYTGRRIKVVGMHEIAIDQTDCVYGRLTLLPNVRGSPDETRSSPSEVALFRSAVGNLRWATSESRPDLAVHTSRLQKVQNGPTYRDYRELARVLTIAKNSADLSLRFMLHWGEASLRCRMDRLQSLWFRRRGAPRYREDHNGGSTSPSLTRWLFCGRDRCRSSRGDGSGTLRLMDWRSRAPKRVLHSMFAAEATMALEAASAAAYLRCYLFEVCVGPVPVFS